MDKLSYVALTAALVGSAGTAYGHIDLDREGGHLSRYGSGEIKQGPCGRTGGARGTNIYRYAPGATITLSVNEFIPHPGYFRIAFDADGDDDFQNPESIEPPREVPGNDTLLLTELDIHERGDVTTYTWEVTLPDIECDNCTLQVTQVMTDKPPYDPDGNDLYYQCIDLVLAEGEANPDPGLDAGIVDVDGSMGMAGPIDAGSAGEPMEPEPGATGGLNEGAGAMGGGGTADPDPSTEDEDDGASAMSGGSSGGCAVAQQQASGLLPWVVLLFVLGYRSRDRWLL